MGENQLAVTFRLQEYFFLVSKVASTMGGGEWHQPDLSKYKWEEIPKLRNYEAKLAEHGLKDPWKRNYVWRYMNPYTDHGRLRWWQVWNKVPGPTRGMAWGVIAVLTYIGIDQTLRRTGVIKDDGGHH